LGWCGGRVERLGRFASTRLAFGNWTDLLQLFSDPAFRGPQITDDLGSAVGAFEMDGSLHFGPTRSAGGHAGGSFPAPCSAACMATM
jgi:hypothetical protein